MKKKKIKFIPLLSLVALSTVGCGLALQSVSSTLDHNTVVEVEDTVTIRPKRSSNKNGFDSYIVSFQNADNNSQVWINFYLGVEINLHYTVNNYVANISSYDIGFSYYLSLPQLYYSENTLNYWSYSNSMPLEFSTCNLGQVLDSVTVSFGSTELEECYFEVFGVKNYFGDTSLTLPYTLQDYSAPIKVGTDQNLIDQAYNEGKQDGYDEGWQDGVDSSLESNGFAILLNTILQSPAYMIGEIFNFEIFGINFRTVVSVILTIGIVILAISIFKGKE